MEHEVDAIVMGGSAGALEALSRLLPALRPPCDVALVVVVHVLPTRPSGLVEVLAHHCALPVREIEDKEPVAEGIVFVSPPAYHVLIERDRSFALSVDEKVRHSRPSLDVLFESAAEAYGPRLAGVVLSGANDDGARGLRAIEAKGGLCAVQSPDTAVARTMPEAAIALAHAPEVLPPKELARWVEARTCRRGRPA